MTQNMLMLSLFVCFFSGILDNCTTYGFCKPMIKRKKMGISKHKLLLFVAKASKISPQNSSRLIAAKTILMWSCEAFEMDSCCAFHDMRWVWSSFNVFRPKSHLAAARAGYDYLDSLFVGTHCLLVANYNSAAVYALYFILNVNLGFNTGDIEVIDLQLYLGQMH